MSYLKVEPPAGHKRRVKHSIAGREKPPLKCPDCRQAWQYTAAGSTDWKKYHGEPPWEFLGGWFPLYGCDEEVCPKCGSGFETK